MVCEEFVRGEIVSAEAFLIRTIILLKACVAITPPGVSRHARSTGDFRLGLWAGQFLYGYNKYYTLATPVGLWQ